MRRPTPTASPPTGSEASQRRGSGGAQAKCEGGAALRALPDLDGPLGFLDDAIYAEIVLRELRNEISLYEEFCVYREAEEARRKARGEDVKVGRNEWLADKRAALHAKMRKRRVAEGSRWRMRLW